MEDSKHKRTRTITRYLATAATVATVGVCTVLASNGPAMVVAEQAPTTETATGAKVDRLLATNHCDLPEGVIPGHAVITLPGKAPRVMSGEVGFAVWLGADGAERSGDERDGVVHGFCR